MLCNLLVWSALTLVLAAPADDYDGHLQSLFERAWPNGEAPVEASASGSHAGFLSVVESPAFAHAAVGPFDLYLLVADELAKPREAQKVLDQLAKGLAPTLAVMQRHFGGEGGEHSLVAGRRQPILLASSARSAGQTGFDELVALLSWAEDDWTSWKHDGNPIWTGELRAGLNVRTWEAQVFNLSHELAVDQGKRFLEHGLGYYTLAHVAARVMRQGAWGLVPPWMAQGIIDELDIQAYGQAWVGGDEWIRETPGWFRPGWSGFVPQGMSPPAPVVGPPKDLAVTVKKTGASWQDRDASKERHWPELVADLKSDAPASFAFMAEHESFLPRDRALARAIMHLVLHPADEGTRPDLLQALDRAPVKRSNGMFDSEPLPKLVSDVLGGLPEVERIEALPLGEVVQLIGQPEIGSKLEALGAGPLLDLSDHREQCQWLYRQSMPADKRRQVWNLILDAEYYQQLHQWKAIGQALDVASHAALSSSKRFPRKSKDALKVDTAFWDALAELES